MLLFGAGMTYWFLASRRQSAAHRVAIAVLVLAVLGIGWAELAVGLLR